MAATLAPPDAFDNHFAWKIPFVELLCRQTRLNPPILHMTFNARTRSLCCFLQITWQQCVNGTFISEIKGLSRPMGDVSAWHDEDRTTALFLFPLTSPFTTGSKGASTKAWKEGVIPLLKGRHLASSLKIDFSLSTMYGTLESGPTRWISWHPIP